MRRAFTLQVAVAAWAMMVTVAADEQEQPFNPFSCKQDRTSSPPFAVTGPVERVLWSDEPGI